MYFYFSSIFMNIHLGIRFINQMYKDKIYDHSIKPKQGLVFHFIHLLLAISWTSILFAVIKYLFMSYITDKSIKSYRMQGECMITFIFLVGFIKNVK